MIEPKPLSEVERAAIEYLIDPRHGNYPINFHIRELLAAEAYWRNVVKTLDPATLEWRNEDGDLACFLCDEIYSYTSRKFEHKPDCACLLAQDGE